MNNVHWATATDPAVVVDRATALEALRPEDGLRQDQVVLVLGTNDDIALDGTYSQIRDLGFRIMRAASEAEEWRCSHEDAGGDE